jgi:hypothetical protein
MIVERPLGGATRGIDISLCATPADGALRAWPRHAAWPAIQDFYRAWMDRDSALHRPIPSIWLEFDGPQLASAQPVPCFFANMRRLAAPERQAAVASILKIFATPRQQAAAQDRLDSVLHHLPPHAHLDFLGLMLARAPASTRACLSMPSRQLLDFLGRAGYHVDVRVHAMARLAMQHNDRVVLHLDLDAGRDSTIGLELKPVRDDGWPALLAALEHERLCTTQERAALLDFPRKAGMARRGCKLGSPDELSGRAPQRWMDADAFAFARRLNHVKLVCAPGQAPAAKAYLHIDYKWKCRTNFIGLAAAETL